jgi:DNA-binding transcriptional ArsR family regulator
LNDDQDNVARRARDQQILSRLAVIEHKVDSLDQTTAFALRADAEKHQTTIRLIFEKRVRRAQVYLAINGQRTRQAIAKHLGMKEQNVSRELVALKDQGLVEAIDKQGGNVVWARKTVDRSLRISKFLQDFFSLTPEGLPKVGKKPAKKGKEVVDSL